MSILGVSNSSWRHASSAHHHDCRVHQYMSEPLPPPPTPPVGSVTHTHTCSVDMVPYIHIHVYPLPAGPNCQGQPFWKSC